MTPLIYSYYLAACGMPFWHHCQFAVKAFLQGWLQAKHSPTPLNTLAYGCPSPPKPCPLSWAAARPIALVPEMRPTFSAQPDMWYMASGCGALLGQVPPVVACVQSPLSPATELADSLTFSTVVHKLPPGFLPRAIPPYPIARHATDTI